MPLPAPSFWQYVTSWAIVFGGVVRPFALNIALL